MDHRNFFDRRANKRVEMENRWMNRNAVLAVVAGLMGGMLTRYIQPPSAFAQNPAPVVREIRAMSFTLVDSLDRPAGTFTVENTGPRGEVLRGPDGQVVPPLPGATRIVLRDARGRQIWSAGGTGMLPITER
jgi:hypothetical protein